jgi:hypothetical protein
MGEIADEIERAIIENEDTEILMGDGFRADDCTLKNGDRLVIGDDKDVHSCFEQRRVLSGVGILAIRERKK